MGALTDESRLLDLRVELWKARSQAKQKYLERVLSERAKGPRDAERRLRWVKRALDAIVPREAAVKSREAWLKVYAEHLSGLRKILSCAAERISDNGEEPVKPDPSPP